MDFLHWDIEALDLQEARSETLVYQIELKNTDITCPAIHRKPSYGEYF